MQAAGGEGMTEEERKLKQQKAMADPEIQNILTDPIMRCASHMNIMPQHTRCIGAALVQLHCTRAFHHMHRRT